MCNVGLSDLWARPIASVLSCQTLPSVLLYGLMHCPIGALPCHNQDHAKLIRDKVARWRERTMTPWKFTTGPGTGNGSVIGAVSEEDLEASVTRAYSLHSSLDKGATSLAVNMAGFLRFVKDSNIIDER